jgi:hypothetical protein
VRYNNGVSRSQRYDHSEAVFVVVRVDLFQLREAHLPDDPQVFVTVKEVVGSEEQAAAEVERLTHINAGKDVVYFYERGRYLPSEA